MQHKQKQLTSWRSNLFSTHAQTRVQTFDAELVLEAQNKLGEGVLWDDKKQEVVWIDNFGKKFCSFNPSSSHYSEYKLPEKPGSFALLNDRLQAKYGPDVYLIAFENGPAFYDIQKAMFLERVFVFEPRNQIPTFMNDGRVDNEGRFVVGGANEISMDTMEAAAQNPASNVYRISNDGKAYQVLYENIALTNSICFSVDGRSMFFTDCLAWNPKHIRQMQYSSDDALPETDVNKEGCNMYVRAEEEGGLVFDGSVVDAEDGLWNAQPFESRVVRYNKEDREIDMVVNFKAGVLPTCPVFGGRDLDTLYVVSIDPFALGTGEPSPQNGAFYACKVPVKGRVENRFGNK